jgi:hypothetical protein
MLSASHGGRGGKNKEKEKKRKEKKRKEAANFCFSFFGLII